MSNISAITFDCYGTLIDWEKGLKQTLREILDGKNLQIKIDELLKEFLKRDLSAVKGSYKPYKEILKISLKKSFSKFGIPYEDRDGQALVSSMPGWKAFPDVKPTLQELSRHYKLAIISNVDDDIISRTLQQIDFFLLVITSQQAKIYKPCIEIFTYALQKLGLDPRHVMHVAFSFEYDIKPALQLGMNTVWLNRKMEPVPKEPKPDHVIKQLNDLREILSL